MKHSGKLPRSIAAVLVAAILFTFWGGLSPERAFATDEFDTMRDKWKTMLTGGPDLSTTDPDIAARTAALAMEAQSYWSAMDLSPTRTYIWYALRATKTSDQVNESYSRLRTMTLAATTVGSSLYGNASLKQDIIDALDWLYANSYNTTIGRTSYNWWHWQIGIPLSLNDIVALLYDDLTPAQLATYGSTVDYFTPAVNLSGANRAWQAVVVGVRAVLVKDSAKAAAARDGLSGAGIFPYATSGDGFYADGSFIQHSRIAYTGGYGLSLLQMTSDLMYLLSGSSAQVTDPNQAHVWQWAYDSFQPLMYKGAMMDMVRGREISRNYAQDHAVGHAVIAAIIRLSQFAPEPHASAFKSMAKGWIQDDTFSSFYSDASPEMIALAKGIVADSAISPPAPLNKVRQFAGMDRSLLLRPGFAFGIAMFSTRINSFEAINGENGKGWYTGAGATYLYNGDLAQYSEDYWPTVDSYRLPGTTVVSQTANAAQTGTTNWAGGSVLDGTYGAAGMDLSYASYNLTGRKSWFLFDDEIVALGAGISSTATSPVETIVENRKLNLAGDNAWTVDGTAQPTALGASQTLTSVRSMHLSGNAASGSDIGYYFPDGATLRTKREARTGNWKQINNRSVTPATNITRNYQTAWIDHGTAPTDASYAYTVLPNASASATEAYASSPETAVLANTGAVQAAKETTLNLIGANFWTDSLQTVDLITSNKKASIMTRETPDTSLAVAVSDPTQANAGTIQIELARSASGYTADPGITVTQLSPTIKFTVNVNGAKGKSFQANFTLGTNPGGGDPEPEEPELVSVIVDNADATGVTKTGTWKTAGTQTDRYGANYLHDDNAAKGTKSVTFAPTLPSSGYYRVSMMWPQHANREDAVQVGIVHDGATSTAAVDQRSNGGVWNPLGTYYFQAGTGGSVTIRNDALASPDGFVVADAVRFERLPDPIIVDNADSSGVTKIGTWTTANTQADRYGADYLHDGNAGKGTKSVTFTPELPISGTYEVYLMWPEHFNREDAVQVDVVHNGTASTVAVDQRSNGGVWNLIGTYAFQAGTGGSVTIRNDALASPDGYVVADAVKFVPVG
ncbi:polysaccharide lyase family 8 super-sandwich domain-containing protein [Cohnella thailandensis]|uniref:Hyaluronate lyase n=1 Tax=Cohnella thailandensis TaxID=557557 RepID=A0A841T4D2_9BACL|nr:polysaccharide lyase family 8 super-sandwich domain-containing protein [Cohnella thailandensis]MBB6637696.1 hypothetical protein [Cohnella thailandensis]MBP1974127.1 hyaluronate lyase [Cohnella thailandensis]